MAAIGFADTAADTFERAGPYLVRGRRRSGADDQAARRLPRHDLLHDPQLSRRRSRRSPGRSADNGYSLASSGTIAGAGNPYVYPDNLPRVNARGGPEGRPGCWQKITRELWPAPYLVMDTGYSHRPLQPRRARPAVLHRVCVGPPDRRAHHQPLTPRRMPPDDASVGQAEKLYDAVVAARRVAAVDRNRLAGEERGVGGHEKRCRGGDLLRLAAAVKGVLLGDRAGAGPPCPRSP